MLGFTEKSNFLEGGSKKHIRGNCLKAGGIGQFADLGGGLGKKRGDVFEVG